jgi:hypothetical protein
MRKIFLSPAKSLHSLRRQGGIAIIEFALVAIIFFALLLGIMEFGRWLFTLNAAREATRWGVRVAVVCGSTPSEINSYVAVMLRSGDGAITIDPTPLSLCTTSDCIVTAKLEGATFTPLIPFLGGSYALPNFTTSLPREALGAAGNATDVCPQ